MGILTDDMKRIVREQRLGYIATVCPDGTPNLSPKGTTAVWDDDHLVFADVLSGTARSTRSKTTARIPCPGTSGTRAGRFHPSDGNPPAP